MRRACEPHAGGLGIGMKDRSGQREGAKCPVTFGAFSQMRDELGAALRRELLAPERSKILSCFETVHLTTRERPALIIRSAFLRST